MAAVREVMKPYRSFMDEIEAACRKHGLCISHEDHHGAFEITDLSEDGLEWLLAARPVAVRVAPHDPRMEAAATTIQDLVV